MHWVCTGSLIECDNECMGGVSLWVSSGWLYSIMSAWELLDVDVVMSGWVGVSRCNNFSSMGVVIAIHWSLWSECLASAVPANMGPGVWKLVHGSCFCMPAFWMLSPSVGLLQSLALITNLNSPWAFYTETHQKQWIDYDYIVYFMQIWQVDKLYVCAFECGVSTIFYTDTVQLVICMMDWCY